MVTSSENHTARRLSAEGVLAAIMHIRNAITYLADHLIILIH